MVSCAGNEAPIQSEGSEMLALEESIGCVEAGDLLAGIQSLEELRGAETLEVRVDALRWLGHAHTRNVDPEAALAAYREALQLEPDDAWLHYATGTALVAIGDYEEAVDSYSSALGIDDTHLKSLQWRGHALAVLERYDEAAADLERAVSLLEEARPEAIADWGGDREEMMEWTRGELDRVGEALQGLGGRQR